MAKFKCIRSFKSSKGKSFSYGMSYNQWEINQLQLIEHSNFEEESETGGYAYFENTVNNPIESDNHTISPSSFDYFGSDSTSSSDSLSSNTDFGGGDFGGGGAGSDY